MAHKKLLKAIKNGKDGKNVGIPTGLKKLDSVIYGIQRRYLYTIGASSGVGKTSFTLDIFIYNLLKNAGDKAIAILMYSFEMSLEVLLAKILSRYIYDTFEKVVSFEDILSLTSPISQENYELIQRSEKWLEELDKKLTVYDKALTPNGIYATCKEWLKNYGTFVELGPHKEEYSENDSTMYKVVIIDHISLVAGKGTKKERIDTTCDYMIYFRNKCNISGVMVQQLNRGISSVDRKTQGFELVGLEDFKDSSGTTDASEVVIALYSPYREKVAVCEGYPIAKILKNRFILVEIIKNRYGRSGINIGSNFFGEINMFRELPKPNEINDYTPYLELIPDSKLIISKDDEKEIDNDENLFKF